MFAITFAASRHAAAPAITALDDRVVQWLTRVVRVAAILGSWGAIRTLAWCIFVSLLAFKRFRHLIVYFVVINLTFYLGVLLSATLKRPRPFAVDILGAWNGYALPSAAVGARRPRSAKPARAAPGRASTTTASAGSSGRKRSRSQSSSSAAIS
jgi:hypothetical protein